MSFLTFWSSCFPSLEACLNGGGTRRRLLIWRSWQACHRWACCVRSRLRTERIWRGRWPICSGLVRVCCRLIIDQVIAVRSSRGKLKKDRPSQSCLRAKMKLCGTSSKSVASSLKGCQNACVYVVLRTFCGGYSTDRTVTSAYDTPSASSNT